MTVAAERETRNELANVSLVLLGVAALVLLVACANVGGLLIAGAVSIAGERDCHPVGVGCLPWNSHPPVSDRDCLPGRDCHGRRIVTRKPCPYSAPEVYAADWFLHRRRRSSELANPRCCGDNRGCLFVFLCPGSGAAVHENRSWKRCLSRPARKRVALAGRCAARSWSRRLLFRWCWSFVADCSCAGGQGPGAESRFQCSSRHADRGSRFPPSARRATKRALAFVREARQKLQALPRRDGDRHCHALSFSG